MIEKNKFKQLINDLNEELGLNNQAYTLTIMGAGALIALNHISRATVDIDLVQPEIDPPLLKAIMAVADKHGLDFGWLNSSASVFAKDLPSGWQRRTSVHFEGEHLTIKILGRQDLIFSKLFAAIERPQKDFDDLLSLAPSKQELGKAKKHLQENKRSQLFLDRLDKISSDLLTALSKQRGGRGR